MTDSPKDPRWMQDDPEVPEGLRSILSGMRGDSLDSRALVALADRVGAVAAAGAGGAAAGDGGAGAGAGATGAGAGVGATGAGAGAGTGVVSSLGALKIVGLAAVGMAAAGTLWAVSTPPATPGGRQNGALTVTEPREEVFYVAPPGPDGVADAPSAETPAASESARPRAQRRSRRRTAPASAKVDERDPGPDEADLLQRARRMVAAAPATALSLTDQHATRFPEGLLHQEREVIAIEALARLGRGDAARARAARFFARHGQSAHRRHIEAILSRHLGDE